MRELKVNETEFLGLNFAEMNEEQALEWLLERSRQTTFSYIVTPNVDHMVQLNRDPDTLGYVYREAQLRLCDSRVIALMAGWSGVKLPFVTGSGLTARMLSKPLAAGTRIAMVGGNARQRAWLASTQPDSVILYYEPPMGLRTNLAAQADAATFVEKARADIVLITVGAPQSELIASLIHSRGVARGVALCVGASLEFITGEKRRAPRWVQSLAMEWAFRLLCEPRRLARRYLIDGPRIFSIWMQWVKASGRTLPPAVQVATDRPVMLITSEIDASMALSRMDGRPNFDVKEEHLFSKPLAADVVQHSLQGS